MRRALKKASSATALLIALAFAANISGADEKVRLTGIFSWLTYNEEGDDLLGEEIFIVPGRGGYFVVYQDSEGEPSTPIVAPLKVDGLRISFSLPGALAKRGEFSGTVASAELSGRFARGEREVHLPRKNSYWQ